MHLITAHELQRMHVNNISPLKSIVPEQDVLLESNHGSSERLGRFDFLVFTQDNRTIGIEVLSRPSQGKLKEKLAYAKEVDEFVFALPNNALELYRRTSKKPFKRLAREKFFGEEFCNPKIKAWLLDIKAGRIAEKAAFCDLFNARQAR